MDVDIRERLLPGGIEIDGSPGSGPGFGIQVSEGDIDWVGAAPESGLNFDFRVSLGSEIKLERIRNAIVEGFDS